jgi:hypothetical protein
MIRNPRTFTLPLLVVLCLALPPDVAAETKGTGGTVSTKTCDQKHDACTSYCIGAKKDGKELVKCTEGCAGEWLKCNRSAKRGALPQAASPDITTVSPGN